MKTLSNCLVFAFIVILPYLADCQNPVYSRVRVYADQKALMELSKAGVAIDHGNIKKGVYLESDFSASEIETISRMGYKYDILIEDVVAYYVDRAMRSAGQLPETSGGNCFNTPNYTTPSNFALGTMGGYYKYAEFTGHIDNMFNLFPNLITQKQPIGSFITNDGYPIYWLKISDNPTIDENEPEILFTGVHHAREPEGLTQMIFFMYYLLENYGTDPEITYLVDNLEIYFIPMVNPDGYTYNENTYPNGGGMWRKNRRVNGGNEFGVDINRNYGYKWGYDNQGSSPDSSSETYRGPGAFSETETQAVKYFAEQHNIQITLNYHTYGNLLIYPWGYEYGIFTPDSALFMEWAMLMTVENHYAFGTGDQTVGYITNGDSDDWMYGEQNTKPKDMSFTPEVGNAGDGFWPAQNRIIPLCNETMLQNLMTLRLALKYAIANDESPTLVSQQTGYFNFDIKCLGLDTPSTFTVEIIPLGNELTSVGPAIVFNNMNLLETRYDSVAYTLDGNINPGQQFSFLLSVDNGSFAHVDTITKYYGQPVILFSDDGNSISNWTTQNWGSSNTVYHSPSASITDSPGGNYSNNTTNIITINNAISLNNCVYAAVQFWARWEIEPGYDYVEFEASDDNGNSWTPLCGHYTKPGSPNQDQNNPLYDGFQLNWVFEEVNLNDYLGQSVLLRFKFKSDFWTKEDGFYFDDMNVETVVNTGINDASKQVDISLYPNPSANNITIGIKGLVSDQFDIILRDVLGNVVMTLAALSPTDFPYTLSLDKLPQGVYMVEITGNSISEVKQFVISK